MRLLLDTHIVLWALIDSPHLPGRAYELITAAENEIFVSAASIWEVAIKRRAGRADSLSGADAIRLSDEAGYAILSVTAGHAAEVERLPLLHKDPFDRLLIAQALTEPLVLVTHDATVARYSDFIMRV